MQVSLLVNAAADSAAALTALHTAQALHAHSEHQLYRLFFYRDAVNLANRFAWQGDGDNANAAQQWQAWVQQSGVEALVCVGAAQRRGVIDNDLGSNLAPGFTLAGLGQWADAQINSERIIQFG